MSITHTQFNTPNRVALMPGLSPLSAIAFLGRAASARVARMVAAIKHRLVMRRFARFSDHRFRDLGFERDRDGSIIPATPDPGFPWAGDR